MGKLINANKEEFKDILKSESEIVLVDFWAEWCSPCRMLSPVLEEVSEESDVVIVKVNVDENSELSAEYGVKNIPTMILFKNEEVLDKISGLKSKKEIIEKIESLSKKPKEDDESKD